MTMPKTPLDYRFDDLQAIWDAKLQRVEDVLKIRIGQLEDDQRRLEARVKQLEEQH